MTRIILSGCFGKMGKVITNLVSGRDDCEIVAGIDINEGESSFPVFKNFSDLSIAADVVIDFSHPSALNGLLEYAIKSLTPAVIATTGLSDEQIEKIHSLSSTVPLFFSANMSIGISLISELAAKAARVLEGSFDIEIVEMHHNQKIDSPSGTALMLADSISDALCEKPKYEFDRHSKRAKRSENEIGIHSVRGGTIVGEHEIIFSGLDEVITISHSARSKELFAVGAVNAAVFLKGKPAGFYSMKELVADK
ncbi:MAG: 4-hydroxy-tetrahydrodipicolinate reductase [Oscillospiraceae bacterium]